MDKTLEDKINSLPVTYHTLWGDVIISESANNDDPDKYSVFFNNDTSEIEELLMFGVGEIDFPKEYLSKVIEILDSMLKKDILYGYEIQKLIVKELTIQSIPLTYCDINGIVIAEN